MTILSLRTKYIKYIGAGREHFRFIGKEDFLNVNIRVGESVLQGKTVRYKYYIIKTLIVSTVLKLLLLLFLLLLLNLLLLLFRNCCMVYFFLYNHLLSFIYPYFSFCMVHFFLIKPLKSNFLQFLEEASTGQCVGAIP